MSASVEVFIGGDEPFVEAQMLALAQTYAYALVPFGGRGMGTHMYRGELMYREGFYQDLTHLLHRHCTHPYNVYSWIDTAQGERAEMHSTHSHTGMEVDNDLVMSIDLQQVV